MDRTVTAGCLVFLEGAVSQSEAGIFQKFPAIGAELSFCLVLAPAVDTDHVCNGFLFPFHAGMHAGHYFLHAYAEKLLAYWGIRLAG